jgi:ribosome maturation factor RimP
MMIKAELIRELLEEELTGMGFFLVGITVKPVNRIVVYIDSMSGVTIDECITVSRYLENRLNRDGEVFELEVSSPGLDKPLKLPVQFEKNIGRLLTVVKYDGHVITGKLLRANHEIIQLESEVSTKESKTGKKRTGHQILEIKFEEIKKAKVVISFKK